MAALPLLYLLALLYFYPLTIRLHYQDGSLDLAWLPRLWGSYASPRPLPWAKKAGLALTWERLSQVLGHWQHFSELLGHVSVLKLDCRLSIGGENPCSSSILAGLALACLGSLGAVISASCKSFPDEPYLEILPAWSGKDPHSPVLRGSIECIFSLSLGDIISRELFALWLAKKGEHKNV